MATFTMTFKEAMEREPEIESRILAQYPIFSEAYRPRLNELIKDRYLNEEIGMETVSMFMLALKRKLNETMPLYNEHYKTSLKAAGVDPLQTISMDSESSGNGKTETGSESDSSSESNARSRAVASDFPQVPLSGNGDYASSSQDNTSNTKATSKGAEKGVTSQDTRGKNTVRGTQGQASLLLLQHRQTLVNVDVMVLNELKDLFMGIWSNGDEFTDKGEYVNGYGIGYGNIFGGIW